MIIDWFTSIAQVLNFLILVWLLKRFLYKPVLNAIDAREKRIESALLDAAEKKAAAQKERDDFQHRNEEFARERETLLNTAKEEASAERRQLLDAAREEADALRANRLATLKDEQLGLSLAISRRTRQEVFAIARKALADLAGTSLEERMIEAFVHRLRELKDEEKMRLTSALKAEGERALVRTVFDLAPAQGAVIEGAITDILGLKIQLRFETAPELISGIELISNGQKVAWSIRDYLVSMEKGIDDLLKEKNP